MRTSICIRLATLLFITGLMACNNEMNDIDDEYPYDYIEEGGFFLRGNTVRFYYMDGNGNNIIDPEDVTSLPISYNNDEKLPSEPIIPKDYKEGFYNGNHNTVCYDEHEKLYYITSSAYGEMSQPTYTFYIGIKDDFDKMEVTYRYTDKNVIGGKYHAKIVSWKYNGTHVYSDDDGWDKKVFITKQNGQTTVSLTR